MMAHKWLTVGRQLPSREASVCEMEDIASLCSFTTENSKCWKRPGSVSHAGLVHIAVILIQS